MLRFIGFRLLQLPLILVIIYLVTFMLCWVAPGDPFNHNDRQISENAKNTLKNKFHAQHWYTFLAWYPYNAIRARRPRAELHQRQSDGQRDFAQSAADLRRDRIVRAGDRDGGGRIDRNACGGAAGRAGRLVQSDGRAGGRERAELCCGERADRDACRCKSNGFRPMAGSRAGTATWCCRRLRCRSCQWRTSRA